MLVERLFKLFYGLLPLLVTSLQLAQLLWQITIELLHIEATLFNKRH